MTQITALSNFKKEQLTRLKNDEEIKIDVPFVERLVLTIHREIIQSNVLGIPTTFYGEDRFVAKDNDDSVFPDHKLVLSADEMMEYIQALCEAKSRKEFHYIRRMKEKGVKVGSLIQFKKDGKKAIIAPLSDECPDVPKALFYIPLKKDGTPSKVKPRIIYGGSKFEFDVLEFEGL